MYKNQLVCFLDTKHGFWRTGTCYGEDKNFYRIRIQTGKRFKVSTKEPDNIKLWEDPKKQAKKNEKDTR